jgi:hypothetical protein
MYRRERLVTDDMNRIANGNGTGDEEAGWECLFVEMVGTEH